MNDMLDRDGSRTPVEFECGLGIDEPVRASIVQAATKWKRWALKQFECDVGEGINTDMRAVRKDYFLDHDHSSYVDQWDWEQVITADDRTPRLPDRTSSGKSGRSSRAPRRWSWRSTLSCRTRGSRRYPTNCISSTPKRSSRLYPDLPRKERETRIIEEYGAVFIYGIGWVLDDGYPHEMRAADYDDWVTPTIEKDGKLMHGLNGDILVYNHVTKRRHELTSMGVQGHGRDAARADEDRRSRRRAVTAVSPDDLERRDSAVDRRGHRSVAGADVAAQKSAPGRGQHDRLAETASRDLRKTQYSCIEVRRADTFGQRTCVVISEQLKAWSLARNIQPGNNFASSGCGMCEPASSPSSRFQADQPVHPTSAPTSDGTLRQTSLIPYSPVSSELTGSMERRLSRMMPTSVEITRPIAQLV